MGQPTGGCEVESLCVKPFPMGLFLLLVGHYIETLLFCLVISPATKKNHVLCEHGNKDSMARLNDFIHLNYIYYLIEWILQNVCSSKADRIQKPKQQKQGVLALTLEFLK